MENLKESVRGTAGGGGDGDGDLAALADDVKQLMEDMEALRSSERLRSKETEGTAKAAKAGGKADEGTKKLAKQAENAAKAAEASAQAAAKCRQEVEEILSSMEVPPSVDVEAILDGRADEALADEVARGGSPGGRGSISPGKGALEKEDETLDAFMERQMQVEARLKQLEAELEVARDDAKGRAEERPSGGDGSTGGADGESQPPSPTGSSSALLSGLGVIIKDVRLCLQRCELMYQLPEIRLFVKRFMRSLQVSAVLNQRWLGPGAGKVVNGVSAVTAATEACAKEDAAGGPGVEQGRNSRTPPEGGGGHRMLGGQDSMSASAPDLGGGSRYGKMKRKQGVDGKKRPFRTVVDWTRPHTPLAVGPVSRIDGVTNFKPEPRVTLPQIART